MDYWVDNPLLILSLGSGASQQKINGLSNLYSGRRVHFAYTVLGCKERISRL